MGNCVNVIRAFLEKKKKKKKEYAFNPFYNKMYIYYENVAP